MLISVSIPCFCTLKSMVSCGKHVHKSKRVIFEPDFSICSRSFSVFWIFLNCCSSIRIGLQFGADHMYF